MLICSLILSTGWSNTLHKQSSYIPTCCGGGHHHHQGRQHYRPKNTCIKMCLSCHEHIAKFRVAHQRTAVDGLPPTYAYVGVRPSTAVFKSRHEIQRCVRDKIDTFWYSCFSVCSFVSPDDGDGRHRNIWEYSLTVCAKAWTNL